MLESKSIQGRRVQFDGSISHCSLDIFEPCKDADVVSKIRVRVSVAVALPSSSTRVPIRNTNSW